MILQVPDISRGPYLRLPGLFHPSYTINTPFIYKAIYRGPPRVKLHFYKADRQPGSPPILYLVSHEQKPVIHSTTESWGWNHHQDVPIKNC